MDSLLNCGGKFVPTPKVDKDELVGSLTGTMDRLKRSLAIKICFRDQRKKPPKFYVSKGNEFTLKDDKHVALYESVINVIDKAYKELCRAVDTKYVPPKDNLSKQEQISLAGLKKDKAIIVKAADKNLGLTLMDRNWYNDETMKHLNDTDVYEHLTQEKWKQKQIRIHGDLKSLLSKETMINNCFSSRFGCSKSQLTEYMASSIPENEFEPCYFYGIPKIHKFPFKLRPISAAHSYPTRATSEVLAAILQEKVNSLKHIVRDTKDFIRQVEEIRDIQAGDILFSADVEALYPSIPIDEAINMIMRMFFPTKTMQQKDEHTLVKEMLYKVLKNHVVQHGDVIALQKQGTAMGTNTGPPFANLFMAALEASIMKEAKDSGDLGFYVRFLDDIEGIWKGSLESFKGFMNKFNQLHPKIKLTFEYSYTSINFLDVTLYKGIRYRVEQRLDIKPYAKAMNRYLYIPEHSYHPTSAKSGFIKGNLIRLICNSSDEIAYLNEKRFFFDRLFERGYNQNFVYDITSSVSFASRHVYLHADKERTETVPMVPIILPYHPFFEEHKLTRYIKNILIELNLSESEADIDASQFLNEVRLVTAFTKHKTLFGHLVSAAYNSENNQVDLVL